MGDVWLHPGYAAFVIHAIHDFRLYLTATAAATSLVSNAAPRLSGVSITPVTAGVAATLFYTITDPGADSYEVEVDWGDGTTQTFIHAAAGAFSQTHTYAAADVDFYLVTLTVRDDDGATAFTARSVQVLGGTTNQPPVGRPDAYSVDEDGTLTRTAAEGVLSNDTDADGDALTVEVLVGPTHGTLTLAADGSFTYTPHNDYAGPDSFLYKVRDAKGASDISSVVLTVAAVADVPVATAPATVNGVEGTAIPLNIAAALSDLDGSETLSITVSGVPAGAVLNRGTVENGVWLLTPADLAGLTITVVDNASFDLTVKVTARETANGDTAETSKVITVTAANVAPTLTLSGKKSATLNKPFTLKLKSLDPGADTITGWTITWGDGKVTTVTGNPATVKHTYTKSKAKYQITATATDEDGTFASNTLTVKRTGSTVASGSGKSLLLKASGKVRPKSKAGKKGGKDLTP